MLWTSFDNFFKRGKNIHDYLTRSAETNNFLPRFNNKSVYKFLAYVGNELYKVLPFFNENPINCSIFQDEPKNYLLNS